MVDRGTAGETNAGRFLALNLVALQDPTPQFPDKMCARYPTVTLCI